jgi:hypothetical protein
MRPGAAIRFAVLAVTGHCESPEEAMTVASITRNCKQADSERICQALPVPDAANRTAPFRCAVGDSRGRSDLLDRHS